MAVGIVCAACLAAAAGAIAEGTTVKIYRSQARANPAITRGYAAFNAGNLTAAEAEYERALTAEPGNAQALHGLATIALRKRDYDRAEAIYRRATEIDPRDALAQAALAAFRLEGDALGTETRLKSLLAVQPDDAALHFALGNLHAAAGRWQDAQPAFAGACGLAPEQPDYLFNLAVSLDHLGRAASARRYYQLALAAAARHPAAFDTATAAARLNQLAN